MKHFFCISTLLLLFYISAPARTAGLHTSMPAVINPASHKSPNPLLQKFHIKLQDNRKFIAACLAFPLPVGFLGVHRIFLGTKPYIPVLYAGTLGGCFGVIPFVDFWVIVFSKDTSPYLNNPKFFMWLK